MTLKIQNYRSTTSGDTPPSLLVGQVAFNIPDHLMFLGNGGDVNLDVDGNPVLPAPPTGEGWQAYNMDVGAPGNVSSIIAGDYISVNSSTGNVTVTADVIPQEFGVSSMSIGPATTSPGSTNGGNTFVGSAAGANHGGTGGTNTYVGYQSGKNTVGANNTFVGSQSLTNVTSGSNNVLIGSNAGASIGSTTSFTTIVGTHQGYSGTTGEVIIGRNGNFLRLNGQGALCIADDVATQSFGTAGQVLTSAGDADPPTWQTPAAPIGAKTSGTVTSGGSTAIYGWQPGSSPETVKLLVSAYSGTDRIQTWEVMLSYAFDGLGFFGANSITAGLDYTSGGAPTPAPELTLSVVTNTGTGMVGVQADAADGGFTIEVIAIPYS